MKTENTYHTRTATSEELKKLEPVLEKMFKRNISCIKQLAGGPFSAAVIDENFSIVAIGVNAVLRRKDTSRHAEVEAISRAMKKLGTINLSNYYLVSSHFPCLMCYHAVKWASIRRMFYVFDYEETEKIFGFTGDIGMCEVLGLNPSSFKNDSSLEKIKIPADQLSDRVKTTLDKLLVTWNEYKDRISYDVNL